MSIELTLITREDLDNLRRGIAEDITRLLDKRDKPKIWMRTSEVADFLNVSRSTIHHLRISGILEGHKLHNMWFYNRQQIEKHLEEKQR